LLDRQRPDGRAELVAGLRRDGGVLRRLARQHVLQLQRVDRDRPPGARRVDRQVVRDRGQPGPHGPAARVEEGRVPPGPLERLLRHVLGEGRIAQHGQRDPEHRALEPAHEGDRQLGVPRCETRGRAYDHAMTTTEPTSSSMASGTCTDSTPNSPNAAWAKLTTKTATAIPVGHHDTRRLRASRKAASAVSPVHRCTTNAPPKCSVSATRLRERISPAVTPCSTMMTTAAVEATRNARSAPGRSVSVAAWAGDRVTGPPRWSGKGDTKDRRSGISDRRYRDRFVISVSGCVTLR